MKPAQSAARMIYLFKRVEMLIKSELEAALQDLGVTPGQYTTMSLLASQKPISSAELARRMGISAQSMSETIALLERKGWIARQEKYNNRRVLQIALTNEGSHMLANCEHRVDSLETGLMEFMEAEEIIKLRAWLKQILEKHKKNRFSNFGHSTLNKSC